MLTEYPSYLIFLDLVTLMNMAKGTNYEVFIVQFSTSSWYLLLFWYKYSPHHRVLKRPY